MAAAPAPRSVLPCGLVEQFKHLCCSAAEAAGHVACQRAADAAAAVLRGAVHALAFELAARGAPAPLPAGPRAALLQVAWLALPARCCARAAASYCSAREEARGLPGMLAPRKDH
ncbi:unnamed protein product, partial [Prorocentrum cordatum]